MATPLTDSINALTRYANETTGASDTTLSDAIETLIAGYEQNGGDSTTLIQKSITLNGTYSAEDDEADGYSSVTVNVQNGATMTETQNTYGTEVIISSAQGVTPSATAHTIYFEFEDNTNTTITSYWNGTFVSNAVTATTPTTYDNKTVTLAQLDGTTWYSYIPSTGTYETLLDDTVQILGDETMGGFWIPDLGSVTITSGSEWRITLDGTTYLSTAKQVDNRVYIGNPKYDDKTDDNSNIPFCFYNAGYGAWNGGCDINISGTSDSYHALKVERKVSE